MTPFKFILATTDFSEPANKAVRRAAMLAEQHGARLGIVHVVVPSNRRLLREWFSSAIDHDVKVADARSALHRLATALTNRYDVTPSLEVRTGDLLEELHRTSARVDLLVMGQRRRSALAERVFGSTAQRLVACSRRPVLVVKQEPIVGYQRALVPIDFTPASDAAAFVAATLAPDIDLQIFHAIDSTGAAVMREADVSETVIREWRATQEAALLARMRRSMTRLGLEGRKLRFALGHGSPVKAILRQAQHLDADLLVATQRRRSRIATTVLGHVNSLLARSRCDMLIVSGGVRDPRRSQAVVAPLPMAAAPSSGGVRAFQALVAPGFSWMRSQLPAEAFMAGEHGRPRRAGG